MAIFFRNPDYQRDLVTKSEGAGFEGYLHADAYGGYDHIYLGSNDSVVEVACWAHARRKFFDASYKDWGGGDLQDVVAGAEYLIREGKVDPERIACFGGSYGGYMTYMAVTKTPDVWKAGVAWVGLTDLLAAHEESPAGLKQVYELMMGDPVENEALWRDRSPIHFGENLKAKLLIIHGVNDPRCPISQARTFRDRLLEHGFVEGDDFDYVELDKIGHGSSDIEQALHTFRTITDFLIENV